MRTFDELREAFLRGRLTPQTHVVEAGRIAPFPTSLLTTFESAGSGALDAGVDALRKGRWARLVLNGGMATRFGGSVKGIFPVFDNLSFLELKLRQVERLERELGLEEIPIALMNSVATDGPTNEFLRQRRRFGRRRLTTFMQGDFPRLTARGEPFRMKGFDRAPRGHGDFLWALEECGLMRSWREEGVSHIDFSNIDNLGATLEPDLAGLFLQSGRDMAVELSRKNKGDQGGAACLRDGVAGVLEGLYFPTSYDSAHLTHFNTNNLMFSLESLERLVGDYEFTLPWNVVVKKVEGLEVMQFERIAIDLVFAFNRRPEDHNVLFVGVPREGARGRFYPVKSPEDLEIIRPKLKERLS